MNYIQLMFCGVFVALFRDGHLIRFPPESKNISHASLGVDDATRGRNANRNARKRVRELC